MEKKVATIDRANQMKDETRKKITTYMELKKIGKEHLMGTTIAERSDYFLNHYNDDFISALKNILMKDIDCDSKYEELVAELQTMWECRVDDFVIPGNKQFECLIDFEQFTVFLVASEDQIKKEVVNYFTEMLNIKKRESFAENAMEN